MIFGSGHYGEAVSSEAKGIGVGGVGRIEGGVGGEELHEPAGLGRAGGGTGESELDVFVELAAVGTTDLQGGVRGEAI